MTATDPTPPADATEAQQAAVDVYNATQIVVLLVNQKTGVMAVKSVLPTEIITQMLRNAADMLAASVSQPKQHR